MECPSCGRQIPDDALFCPYCGHEVAGPSFAPLEDPEELKAVASTLKEKYLPEDWSCQVDEKRRRLCFGLSTKAAILIGLSRRSKYTMISTLITALDNTLRHAEEDLGLRFVLEKTRSFLGYPRLCYKVLARRGPKAHPA